MMGSTCQSSYRASVSGFRRGRIQVAYQRLDPATTPKVQKRLELQDTILALGRQGGRNLSASTFVADHSGRSTPSSQFESLLR